MHGAPPLQWSNECALYAQKCAIENQSSGRVHHCFVETISTKRKMGQSIFWSSEASKVTSQVAVQCWYDEGKDPGYDFMNPGYQPGTGQFTALVWYNTTHVGMSRSKDGCYIVANYYPSGNLLGKLQFLQNVLPYDSPLSFRPRNKVEAQLFQEFDMLAKGRESVPKEELEELFAKTGDARYIDAIQRADADGDGFIDPREFAMAMSHPRDSDGENDTIGRIIGFIQADADGDMKVNSRELQRFLKGKTGRRFSMKQAKKILEQFDTDHDGSLDYAELSELLSSGALENELAKASEPTTTTHGGGGSGGAVIVTEMSPKVDDLFAGVPTKDCDPLRRALQQCVEGGGTAEVRRTSNCLDIKFIQDGNIERRRTSWE